MDDICDPAEPGVDPIAALLLRAEVNAPPLRAALLREAAARCAEAGDYERAFELHASAYRVEPRLECHPTLEAHAAKAGQIAELDRLWRKSAPRLAPEVRAAALCDLGRLRLRRRRDPMLALEALDRAWELAPSPLGASLRVEALTELNRLCELDEALQALALLDSPANERARTLLRLAELRQDQLGDARGAREALRRALAFDPTLTPARERLEQLLRRGGRRQELLALLDERAASTPHEVAALFEAAELCEGLERLAEAAQRWTRLHLRVPTDPRPLHALARLHGRLGKLRERVAVLATLVELVESPAERVALHRELAAALTELGERGRAIDSLAWLLASQPDEASFRALTRLCRAEGRLATLAEAYRRWLPAAPAAQRATLWAELADLYEHKLGDPAQAIGCWEARLQDDVDDLAALEALARLYPQVDACDRAADCLERWAALIPDSAERARKLAHAAELCAGRPALEGRAETLLARALVAAPTWVPARAALAAIRRRHGDLLEAGALLDQAGATAGHAALVAAAAALCQAEGDLEGELAQLRTLLRRAPDHLDARRRACALAQTLGRQAELLELAAALPDEGPVALRLERWLYLARAAQATFDRPLAHEALLRAAALAPRNPEVRRLQAEELLAAGEVAAVEELLGDLPDDPAAPVAERAALLFLAGECARRRDDPDAARQRYLRALMIDHRHRPALRQLLELALLERRFGEALAVLARLATLERDPLLRARYRHLAGHLYEEELGRPAEALGQYREALADDPDHLRAGERLMVLLRAKGDFAALLRHCAQTIERLGHGGDPGRRAQLWSALGEAADELGDTAGATAALEVVLRLDDNNWSARRRLATLYLEAGPDAVDQAIAAHQALLRLDRLHVPAYRALGQLYRQRGAAARGAACDQAARLLSARDPAAPPSAPLPAPLSALRPLTEADWRRLRQPEEDPALDTLSRLVSPLLAGAAALRLDRGAQPWLSPVQGEPPFLQALRWTAHALDLPLPTAYTAADQLVPVRFLNGRDGAGLRPALVVGLPLIGDRRRAASLVAPLALKLALMRSERLLRLLVADAEVLTQLLRATVLVALDEPAPRELAVTAAGLKRWLSPTAREQLGVVGRRLRDEGQSLGRVAARWLRAADLSAARTALLLTGDLPRTLAAVQGFEPALLREAVGELIWASITDELWTTREGLVSSPRPASILASRPSS